MILVNLTGSPVNLLDLNGRVSPYKCDGRPPKLCSHSVVAYQEMDMPSHRMSEPELELPPEVADTLYLLPNQVAVIGALTRKDCRALAEDSTTVVNGVKCYTKLVSY